MSMFLIILDGRYWIKASVRLGVERVTSSGESSAWNALRPEMTTSTTSTAQTWDLNRMCGSAVTGCAWPPTGPTRSGQRWVNWTLLAEHSERQIPLTQSSGSGLSRLINYSLSIFVWTRNCCPFQCSATCGSGAKYREAKCLNVHGAIMADSDCDPGAKVLAQSCNNNPCPVWAAGSWTGVSNNNNNEHRTTTRVHLYWCLQSGTSKIITDSSLRWWC